MPIRAVVRPPRRAAKPSADHILQAAEAAFARHGYGAISLRQLIAAARVSTTAFYARFDSKEAVMGELTQRLFADLYAAAPAVLDRAPDLAAGVDRGVALLCEHLGPRRALVRTILAEAGAAPAAVTARRQGSHLLAAVVAARLPTRGRARVADPSALAWALVGALEIQVVRWAVWEEIELPALGAHLRAAARALLPGLGAA